MHFFTWLKSLSQIGNRLFHACLVILHANLANIQQSLKIGKSLIFYIFLLIGKNKHQLIFIGSTKFYLDGKSEFGHRSNLCLKLICIAASFGME